MPGKLSLAVGVQLLRARCRRCPLFGEGFQLLHDEFTDESWQVRVDGEESEAGQKADRDKVHPNPKSGGRAQP